MNDAQACAGTPERRPRGTRLRHTLRRRCARVLRKAGDRRGDTVDSARDGNKRAIRGERSGQCRGRRGRCVCDSGRERRPDAHELQAPMMRASAGTCGHVCACARA
jgi:hypothetical protein